MKRLFAFIAVLGMLYLGASTNAVAQDETQGATTEVAKDSSTDVSQAAPAAADNEEKAAAANEENKSVHNMIKMYFIQGGPGFMTSILICLLLGLSFALERVIYLNLSSTNNKKLLLDVEDALSKGGIEAAKEVCRNTRGPVASIFYQGLDRSEEGLDVVEKTVVSYGSVQASLLEKGLSWIGLFIGIAPMLGFLGTVIGLIQAFDAIQIAGDISPALVAGGMKVALITTVGGLIVAIILQIFYNYCLSKIDSVVNSMEDSSISLIDILVKHNLKK